VLAAGLRVAVREVGVDAGSDSTVARVLLRVRSVKELLEALHLAAQLVAFQGLELFCGRLCSAQVLHRSAISRLADSQHVGDSSAALPDRADSARANRNRRAALYAVDLTLAGLGTTPHSRQLGGLVEELDSNSFQHRRVGVGIDGSGQVSHCCLQRVPVAPVGVLTGAGDHHLCEDADAKRVGCDVAGGRRERVVDDHDVAGVLVGVDRGGDVGPP
jgi:hypothetical protein